MLPKALSMAIFGALATVTALMPVAISGSEVAVASSTRPIHEPDSPVFSPIASASRVSLAPA